MKMMSFHDVCVETKRRGEMRGIPNCFYFEYVGRSVWILRAIFCIADY